MNKQKKLSDILKRQRSNKPEYQIKIAEERIHILFTEAEKMVKKDHEMADNYIKLARKIGMRYNVRMDGKYRRRYCKYCYAYLHPGITADVRLRKGVMETKCKKCGKINNFPFKAGASSRK
jgi:ribonuclease P protein subunit RPR2